MDSYITGSKNMTVQETIKSKLDASLHPEHLEVINESNMHNVPPGSESHFKLIVVAEDFNDLSLINRHRKINQILTDELQNQIHALSIHAYTSKEWAEKEGMAPQSPPCLGGGKQ